LGKPVASDLEQGKMSLATLSALRRSDEAEQVLRSKDPACVVQLLAYTGALEYAMSRAGAYSERAKEALSILPRSEARAELSRLADFASVRDL
jgi:octaprenyl-diphosphate synthase